MKKAMEIAGIKIHCDTCHHEFEGNPRMWLNKECPRCGAADIINDADIEALNALETLANAINSVAVNPGEGEPLIKGQFTLNTAALRG